MPLPCPAVRELKRALRGSIPYLAGTYREHNGEHLTRLQWRKDGTLNRHDAGLALDIILFASVPSERVLAENLVTIFLDFHNEMRWLSIIYENVAFSSRGIPGLYLQDRRHYTHIHIDWFSFNLYERAHRRSIPWPAEANTSGFSALLSGALVELNAQWSRNALSSMDLMHIPRMEIGPITAE
ncbi:MAG: hypothetical protein WBP93_01790 [Pyrinomonadaceae bacterium]